MTRALLAAAVLLLGTRVAAAADYEVWVADQSPSRADGGGGTLYVYRGRDLTKGHPAGARPEAIDLGGAAHDLCVSRTGSAPRKPHMLHFDHAQSHAIVSYVATGHVLFLEAATRRPVECLDVGEEAHATFPTPDRRHAIVANQGGKRLTRLRTDYTAGRFAIDPAGGIDLRPHEDPVRRPDNAPICPVIEDAGRLAFVTLRGGGLLVVDVTTTPMTVVAAYDRETIHPNGCGGAQAAGKVYLRSGGGSERDPMHADLYAIPLAEFGQRRAHAPNTPRPALVFSHDDRVYVDAHGGTLTKGGRYLWVGDRMGNRVVVVDTASDRVVNEIALSGRESPDPAPDVMDVSPGGDFVFASLRGPKPLSANVPGHDNAVGATPGVAVIQVDENGWAGRMVGVAPITRVVNGEERADPHGLKVRWP